jgi:uncharacterized protein (TIGR00725 family)
MGARRPVIGVMGAGEPSPPQRAAARRLGRLIAEAGWILLTGGRPAGVMDAASAGAKVVPGSLTLGILPGGPDDVVSDHVDLAVFTGMGNARDAINVLSSDVVVACGVEGPGTAAEVALALKAGRPTILLGTPANVLEFYRPLDPGGLLHHAATPEAAMDLIRKHLS